jgi:hypothetical protein
MAQGLLVPMDMSICASCGLQLAGDSALCPHHHCVFGDDWAEGNRLMCDFFHRGKVPPRLAGDEQEDDLWPQFDEATSEPFSETPLVSRRGLEPRTP